MIVIVMGVSGSGKSMIGRLLADRLGWTFLDADDFHSEANKPKMASGPALTDADRIDWLAELRAALLRDFKSGTPVVLACSALKQAYREQLKVNEHVRFVYLRGAFRVIEGRMRARKDHFMKPEMLRSQFDILEEPSDALTFDVSEAPGQIVDIICTELDL